LEDDRSAAALSIAQTSAHRIAIPSEAIHDLMDINASPRAEEVTFLRVLLRLQVAGEDALKKGDFTPYKPGPARSTDY